MNASKASNTSRLMRLRLFDRIGGGVRRDRAIEAGNYRLDECVTQHLGERLPSAYIRTRQFSLEVYVGRDLFGAAILEQMRGAANR